MARVVADASAVVDLLLGTGPAPRVREALRGVDRAAPAHLDAEVLSAIGRYARRGELSAAAAAARLRALARLPVERYALAPLLVDAWALRESVSLRDALYVALARRLGAALLTTDRRLTRSPGLQVSVIFAGT